MKQSGDAPSTPRGRRKERDERILKAARVVFIADPNAPVSSVAKLAGVGISALYRRYPSKDDLLSALCREGLLIYIAEAQAALASDASPWDCLTGFMKRVVAANTHALVIRLAGTFKPASDLFDLAARAQDLNVRIFERARSSGSMRPGVTVDDINVIGEIIAAVPLGHGERGLELRLRYLTMLLDGMLAGPRDPLPGPAPTWEEIEARWRS